MPLMLQPPTQKIWNQHWHCAVPFCGGYNYHVNCDDKVRKCPRCGIRQTQRPLVIVWATWLKSKLCIVPNYRMMKEDNEKAWMFKEYIY